MLIEGGLKEVLSIQGCCHLREAPRFKRLVNEMVRRARPVASRSEGVRVAVGFNPRTSAAAHRRRVATLEQPCAVETRETRGLSKARSGAHLRHD